MLWRNVVKISLRACCMAILVASAYAQYRAAIQGTVTDPQGAVIPGATVTLTSKETNISSTVTTSESGVYSIGSLAPGHYTLTVDMPGFKKQVLEDVLVTGEQVQGINIKLQIGQLSEHVTVSAPVAPVMNTESASISGSITSKEIQLLPSFARDPFQLLQLAPGVFGDASLTSSGGTASLPGTNMGGPSSTDSIFKTENGAQIFANGTRQNSNSFQIDGVEVNSLAWGGASVITPNEESVKEVRVVSSNYSAENGRNSGAQVLVVSQNGTNDYHGSLFFKFHRPGLNAYQSWNGPGTPSPVQRDNARFNQFGGSAGGPIVKDKLFAFFSYETLRNDSVNTGTGWYETPQFLQNAGPNGSIARSLLSFPGEGASFSSIVSETCAQVGLPSTQCRDVPGGLDLGSPLKSPLGTQDPTYAKPGTPYGIGGGFDGIPDAMFVQTVNPTTSANVQYNGRLDFQATNKDRFTMSVYWVPVDSHFFNGPARAANDWNHSSINQSWTGIWNRSFSATLLNEARFGVSGWNWNEVTSNPQEPWGLPQAYIDGAGSVGIQSFGAPGPSIFDQLTYNARDTLSKVHGSHFLKFGFDFYRETDNDQAPWSARPGYNFRNLWDFANDAPYHENANFDPVTGQPTSAEKNIRSNIIALFVQDDWKLKPTLTLNLGLRWEYYSPITETNGNISNPIPGTGTATLTGLVIQKGGDLFATSKNNWGPQIGFAWNPDSVAGYGLGKRFVVRGGFGIGYNKLQEAITLNGRFNPPFLTSLDLYGGNILYAIPGDVHQFSNWPSNPAAVQTFDPTTGLPTSGAPVTLNGFPSFMPTPVTYRFSLETEFEIAHSWVATIGYQGSQTRHYTRQNNLNWLYPFDLNPRVQNLQWYSDDANAHYNAMLVELKRRFTSTLDFDVQYRFSKTTDQGSQDYYIDQYPFSIVYSNGPSDFDATHNLKLWGTWSPVLFKGNGWLEKVAGGWAIGGILNAHSGYPWTPIYSNTGGNVVYPNSGFSTLRPATYTGGAGTDYSNSTFMQANGNFANGALAYFTVPTWPAMGIPPAPEVGRNSFRGPRYFGLDLTLSKSFGLPYMPVLKENGKIEIRANFYNVFNKLNLTNLNTTISNDGMTSNPLFGQAQGALGGRIVDLQARFNF